PPRLRRRKRGKLDAHPREPRPPEPIAPRVGERPEGLHRRRLVRRARGGVEPDAALLVHEREDTRFDEPGSESESESESESDSESESERLSRARSRGASTSTSTTDDSTHFVPVPVPVPVRRTRAPCSRPV